MPETLSAKDPKLLDARKRLRRILLTWGLLFAAMGVLSLGTLRGGRALASVPWFAGAAVLLASAQPALLMAVGIHWGLTLVALIPGVRQVLGGDPLAILFLNGPIELAALLIVRIGLMLLAVNQFFFYRLLYGTSQMVGLEDGLAQIPAVVPNRTDRIATAALALGLLSMMGVVGLGPLARAGLGPGALSLVVGSASFAIGLGFGAAFSPTRRRSAGLAGVGLGALSFLMAMVMTRLLGGTAL